MQKTERAQIRPVKKKTPKYKWEDTGVSKFEKSGLIF